MGSICSTREKTAALYSPLMEDVVAKGDIQQLQQMSAQDFRAMMSLSTTRSAAALPSSATLHHLHTRGSPWDHTVCDTAAFHGSTSCLMYAMDHGCPWSRSAGYYAAAGGQLKCLKLLVERYGCPVDIMTAKYAAEKGSVRCLHYLYSSCAVPLVISATSAAGKNGHSGCLDYLLEQGCPVDMYDMFRGCGLKGISEVRHGAVLETLLEHKSSEVKNWSEEMLRKYGASALYSSYVGRLVVQPHRRQSSEGV